MNKLLLNSSLRIRFGKGRDPAVGKDFRLRAWGGVVDTVQINMGYNDASNGNSERLVVIPFLLK